MHAVVVELISIDLLAQWLVLLRGEPHDAVLIQEYFQWVTAEDQNVESKIELEFINQVRLKHVLLDHKDFVCWDIIDIAGEEDAFALAHTVWLYDHSEVALALRRFWGGFPRAFLWCIVRT